MRTDGTRTDGTRTDGTSTYGTRAEEKRSAEKRSAEKKEATNEQKRNEEKKEATKTRAEHPSGWCAQTHYGRGKCGQSCPCCRSLVEPPTSLGVCLVCSRRVSDADEHDLADGAEDMERRVE
jgi:hypothetical protein